MRLSPLQPLLILCFALSGCVAFGSDAADTPLLGDGPYDDLQAPSGAAESLGVLVHAERIWQVADVRRGSLADELGVRAGDTLVSTSGQALTRSVSPKELAGLLEAGRVLASDGAGWLTPLLAPSTPGQGQGGSCSVCEDHGEAIGWGCRSGVRFGGVECELSNNQCTLHGLCLDLWD